MTLSSPDLEVVKGQFLRFSLVCDVTPVDSRSWGALMLEKVLEGSHLVLGPLSLSLHRTTGRVHYPADYSQVLRFFRCRGSEEDPLYLVKAIRLPYCES